MIWENCSPAFSRSPVNEKLAGYKQHIQAMMHIFGMYTWAFLPKQVFVATRMYEMLLFS
jgi:hypothetical protein